MAVDSQAKRMSATFLLLPFYTQGIVADGSIDADDRQAAAWVYGGILAPEPAAAVVPETIDIGLPIMERLVRLPSLPARALGYGYDIDEDDE